MSKSAIMVLLRVYVLYLSMLKWKNMILGRKCLAIGRIDEALVILPSILYKFVAVVLLVVMIFFIWAVQATNLCSGRLIFSRRVSSNQPSTILVSSNFPSAANFVLLISATRGRGSFSWTRQPMVSTAKVTAPCSLGSVNSCLHDIVQKTHPLSLGLFLEWWSIWVWFYWKGYRLLILPPVGKYFAEVTRGSLGPSPGISELHLSSL